MIAVTGASRGIGLAIVELPAAKGVQVIGGAREIKNPHVGGPSLSAMDVSSETSTLAIASTAISAGVDTPVNNAGDGSFTPMETILLDDYRRLMDSNVLGVILARRSFMPHVRARHGQEPDGQIVAITNEASSRTIAIGRLYCASKHAQHGLTKILTHEGKRYGLRETDVRPGMTDTSFTGIVPGNPGRGLDLKPADTARAVL